MESLKYNSFEELLKNIPIQINTSISVKLADYEISGITDHTRKLLIELLGYNIYIYDYTPTTISNNCFTRLNCSSFVPKNIAFELAQELSSNGYFVGIHNAKSEIGHLYKHGHGIIWTNKNDFTTSFKLEYNSLGNPMIKNIEHVWDYGSDVDFLKKFITDAETNEYVELTIVAESFNTTSDTLLDNILTHIKQT